MRRRRKITRFLIRGMATALVGGFLGFLVPQVITDLTPKPDVSTGVVPESPVARQFINAFTSDDQLVLTEMGISTSDKLRSSRLSSDFARVDRPVHLGSYVSGGFSLHGYAAHAVNHDGSETTLAWRVATAGGQIILIYPAGQIEEP